MTAILHQSPALLDSLSLTADQARRYADQAKAPNTARAYRSDWRLFCAWCDAHGCVSLPAAPETVGLYITQLAEHRKPATIQRRLSAISQAHQFAHHDSPVHDMTVRAVWAGIRRAKGTRQQAKAPTLTADLRAMVAMLPPTIHGTQARALLLLGFAGAFRRSELVGLDVADLDFTRDGLRVLLRRSKTDQEGQGRTVGIPYGSHPATCPIRNVQAWLEVAGITAGPVFRTVSRHGHIETRRLSDKAVARAVKRAAAAVGLDPARYAGHSLRAGLATAAAAAGVSERAIMAQTGHKSTTMLRRYIRDGELFRENAAAAVGL